MSSPSLNEVRLLGRLGMDPEVRFSKEGKAWCSFTMATTDKRGFVDGQRAEKTEWHRCVAFGKTAELIGEYCSKGRLVLVLGALQTRDWTDKDQVKRSTTEIVVDRIVFLGDKRGEGRGGKESREGEEERRDEGDNRQEGEDRRDEGGW